jgi:hypothetical protein
MLRRGCPLHANKAPARETNHYALVCMRARRRVEVYVIGVRCLQYERQLTIVAIVSDTQASA